VILARTIVSVHLSAAATKTVLLTRFAQASVGITSVWSARRTLIVVMSSCVTVNIAASARKRDVLTSVAVLWTLTALKFVMAIAQVPSIVPTRSALKNVPTSVAPKEITALKYVMAIAQVPCIVRTWSASNGKGLTNQLAIMKISNVAMIKIAVVVPFVLMEHVARYKCL
jgi:hypothetical protein